MSWRRGQAYAQHLRDRVLAAIDRGMGAYEAARLFQVSVSWIYKALARRRETGESTARPQVNPVPPKLLAYYEAIRGKLEAEPDLTLAELRAWLLEAEQVSFSQRGMWKTLRQLDLTRKKRVPSDLAPIERSALFAGSLGMMRPSQPGTGVAPVDRGAGRRCRPAPDAVAVPGGSLRRSFAGQLDHPPQAVTTAVMPAATVGCVLAGADAVA